MGKYWSFDERLLRKRASEKMMSRPLNPMSPVLRNHQLRKLVAMLISILPLSLLRIKAYHYLLGYHFGKGSRIGFLAMISVDQFVCGEQVIIGRQTQFFGPMSVTIGARTLIGRWNTFDCAITAGLRSKAHMHYARKLTIGDDCLIHEYHYFDLYGEITIGSGTWIAGRGSQFWTHGASVVNRDIHIGKNSYIGSACLFSPNSGLGNRVVLGMGSVVTKHMSDDDVVIAGVPAKIIRQKSQSADELSFTRWDTSGQ
jgi:acetyltransferase-like isoleucine patch superfamily enzyme